MKFITYYSSLVNNNKGITLIEVLVAIVILAFGLLGVAMMQYMAIAGNAYGREMQIATEVGQERLEIIKSVNYATVVNGQIGVAPAMTNAGTYWWLNEQLQNADPSRFGGLPFTRMTWVVDNCRNMDVPLNLNNPCNPNPNVTCTDALNNMRAVTIRVCWIDKNGGNHSVTLNGMKWNETAAP